MLKLIEITEISIDVIDMYNTSKYQHDGLYKVTAGASVDLILKANDTVYNIAEYKDIESVIKDAEPTTEKEGTVSEAFALKMLAVSHGNVENLEL